MDKQKVKALVEAIYQEVDGYEYWDENQPRKMLTNIEDFVIELREELEKE